MTLTFSGWNTNSKSVGVSGFVPVVEQDGTCTLELTKAGSTVAATSTAFPDAGSTSCGWLEVPGAKLSTGSWKAVLSYSSSTNHARSTGVEIEVP